MVYNSTGGLVGTEPPESGNWQQHGGGGSIGPPSMPVQTPKEKLQDDQSRPDNFEGALPGPSGGSTGSGSTPQDGVPSHLDSFFQGSRWDRHDVLVLAAVLQTLILLWWAYSEVN